MQPEFQLWRPHHIFISAAISRKFFKPGGFDYIRQLAYKSIYATAFLESDQSVTLIREGEGNRLLFFIESIRTRIRQCINSSTHPPHGCSSCADYRGTGDNSRANQDRFSALGITAHSFNSGVHVSILGLLAYGIIFNLKLYPRLLAVLFRKKNCCFHFNISGLGVLHDCRDGLHRLHGRG